MIMQLCFPVLLFAVFPFDATFSHPQRHKVEQETVLLATFLRHLKKLRLNALSFFHISKDKTVKKTST